MTSDQETIRELLLREHSRKNVERILRWIGHDAGRCAVLLECFFGNDPILLQRSSWAVGVLAERAPHLLTPHLTAIAKRAVQSGLHPAVQRNGLRVFQYTDIPKWMRGSLYNISADLLRSAETAIAAKAFAMTILFRIAEQEPDLIPETRWIVEPLTEHTSAGVRSRARRVLHALQNNGKKRK